MFLFQWLVTPFALTHPAVTPITVTASRPGSWIGEIKVDASLGLLLDMFISTILSGIPWQVCVLYSGTWELGTPN